MRKIIYNTWVRLLIFFSYRAALMGYINSQHILGQLYTKLGGENLPKAFAWLSIASDHGHANAKEALALLEVKLTIEHLEQGRALIKYYKKNSKAHINEKGI